MRFTLSATFRVTTLVWSLEAASGDRLAERSLAFRSYPPPPVVSPALMDEALCYVPTAAAHPRDPRSIMCPPRQRLVCSRAVAD